MLDRDHAYKFHTFVMVDMVPMIMNIIYTLHIHSVAINVIMFRISSQKFNTSKQFTGHKPRLRKQTGSKRRALFNLPRLFKKHLLRLRDH